MECGVSLLGWNNAENQFFASIIQHINGFTIAGSYQRIQAAATSLPQDNEHLLFINKDVLTAADYSFITELKRSNSALYAIVVADGVNENDLFSALSSGADGWICKPLSRSIITDALNAVINGGAPLCPEVSKLLVDSFKKNPNSPLSKRETEVLRLLSKGKTYRAIADELFITTETAKSHIKHIYSKLKVRSKAEALQKAVERKLI